MMGAATQFAVLVLLVMLIVAGMRLVAPASGREGYLIYPYLDLDEPGERGSYYQLDSCGAP
jgi:hypothetical protein